MKKLINISDLSKDDFHEIIQYSSDLVKNNHAILENKHIGLIFEKVSTRTRLSFQVGIAQLKGNPIDIKLEELNLQRSESFEDTFKIFACYLDALVFRTNDHTKLIMASDYFQKPVVNALSDKSHPCQIIADIYTLKKHFGKIDGLSINWFGDLNNVLFSLIEVMNFLPETELNIFTDSNLFETSGFNHLNNLTNVNFYFELNDTIIKNADCIMTDVYNSMNDNGKSDKEITLKKFQVNKDIMDKTKSTCIFMHCLPAKINSEVTKSVISGTKSIVMDQAKNRLIAQKGILKWLDI